MLLIINRSLKLPLLSKISPVTISHRIVNKYLLTNRVLFDINDIIIYLGGQHKIGVTSSGQFVSLKGAEESFSLLER